jgi:zinc transport system substrate-binding protein
MTHPGSPVRAGRLRLLVCALVSSLLLAAQSRADAPVVVSSIRPLGLLVEALTDDGLQSRVLSSAGSSPHDFVLRPSERAVLNSARLVIWMGPALERPLEGVLRRNPAPSLALLDPAETDPHLWLDPRAAAGMARRISAALVAEGLLPQDEAARRLAQLEARLREREVQTAAALAPLRTVPFLALHDGYRPFVARYGLRQVAALPGDHERQPGARSLLALRRAARESDARCLLHEPGDNLSLAQGLANDLGLRAAEVDPLAHQAGTGPEAFDAFLARFASDVQRCLTPATPIPGDRP